MGTGARRVAWLAAAALGATACHQAQRSPDPGSMPDLGVCVGRSCDVTGCPAGQETTVVGTVFAPNGRDPVPRATVYVPATTPATFSPGVACDLCGTIPGAVTSTLTEPDGGFSLLGVPPGEQVPVVVELGRFRRVISMKVAACQRNLVPFDPDVFGVRLPARDDELAPGDHVPSIAVATGDYDQIECVLKRMGLQQFDLYDDRGPGKLPATVGTFESLLTDPVKLKSYNIVVVNCTEAQFEPILALPGVLQNLEDYVASGGRLYATDWAYDVIHQVPEFAPFMCFVPGGVTGPPPPATCDATPATAGAAHSTQPYHTAGVIREPALGEWLALFPGVVVNGQVPIQYNFVVVNQAGDATHPATVWVDGIAEDPTALPQLAKGVRPLTLTFEYKQCGRVHYSTYNTEPSDVVLDTAANRYPGCGGRSELNPQERILEYLIFEVAQCVGPIA